MGNISSYEVEDIKKETKREIKEVLYNKSKLNYDEIISKIMNKSYLVFVVDIAAKVFTGFSEWEGQSYPDYKTVSERHTIYVEEKICYSKPTTIPTTIPDTTTIENPTTIPTTMPDTTTIENPTTIPTTLPDTTTIENPTLFLQLYQIQ